MGYFSSSTEYPNILENTEHLLSEEQSLKNVRHTDLDTQFTESAEERDFLTDNKINESEVTSNDPFYVSSTTEDYNSSPLTEAIPKTSTSIVVLGNEVLIVDHTKENPVTIIKVQANGLQRGVDESTDDSESHDAEHYSLHSIKSTVEPNTSEFISVSSSTTENYELSSEPIFDTVYYPQNNHEAIENKVTNEDEFSGSSGSGAGSGDLTDIAITEGSSEGSGAGALDIVRNVTKLFPVDSLSSESQEFIRLSPTSAKPEVSSSPASIETSSEIFDIVSTDTPSSPEVSSEIIHETTFYEPSSDASSTESFQSSSKSPETSTQNHFVTDELVPVRKTYIEDDDTHDLIDPGFGRIPDDFHLTATHLDDEISQTRQLSPKKHDDIETPHAQQFQGKSFVLPLGIFQNFKEFDSKKPQKVSLLKNSPAPGEPHLIPEWERNTTVSQNEEDSTTVKVRLENILTHTVNPLHADHSSSEEIDKKFQKDVEPTTTKMPPSNIPEMLSTEEENSSNQSSSSPYQYHPDHDAESIRLRAAPTTDKSIDSLSLSVETIEVKEENKIENDAKN